MNDYYEGMNEKQNNLPNPVDSTMSQLRIVLEKVSVDFESKQVLFLMYPQVDDDDNTSYRMPLETFEYMGRPDMITIAVVPGDTLN